MKMMRISLSTVIAMKKKNPAYDGKTLGIILYPTTHYVYLRYQQMERKPK
jgi:hypothetical protein